MSEPINLLNSIAVEPLIEAVNLAPVDWKSRCEQLENGARGMGKAFEATVRELHELCVAVLGHDPDCVEELDLAMAAASRHMAALTIIAKRKCGSWCTTPKDDKSTEPRYTNIDDRCASCVARSAIAVEGKL